MLREVVFLMCIVLVWCQQSHSQNRMVVRPDLLNINRRSGSRFKIKEVEGVSTCYPNPCKNYGVCRIHDTCLCPLEYVGPLCEDNVIAGCGFEENMCNFSSFKNLLNFTRTNSFSGIPDPPEGSYYALAKSSSGKWEKAMMGAKFSPNKSEVVGKSVGIDFECVTTGFGFLSLMYHDGKNNGTNGLVLKNVHTKGQWKSYNVKLPAGQNIMYFFLAGFDGEKGPGAVAVDKIRFSKPKEN